MRQFLMFKERSDYIYEYHFRWNLRSTTEEGNTKNGSFVEYLYDAFEAFLIDKNPDNREFLAAGKTRIGKLEIYYLQDFHFREESLIRFYKEANSEMVAVFFPKDSSLKGAAFAKIELSVKEDKTAMG